MDDDGVLSRGLTVRFLPLREPGFLYRKLLGDIEPLRTHLYLLLNRAPVLGCDYTLFPPRPYELRWEIPCLTSEAGNRLLISTCRLAMTIADGSHYDPMTQTMVMDADAEHAVGVIRDIASPRHWVDGKDIARPTGQEEGTMGKHDDQASRREDLGVTRRGRDPRYTKYEDLVPADKKPVDDFLTSDRRKKK